VDRRHILGRFEEGVRTVAGTRAAGCVVDGFSNRESEGSEAVGRCRLF